MDEKTEQLPLFDADMELESSQPPAPSSVTPATAAGLKATSPLSTALCAFETYMEARRFSAHTRQAFRLDMQLLTEYLNPGVSLGEIGPAHLNAFLIWMREQRGVPCNDKTLDRRITTLKVFFGWLVEEKVLERDPAAPLIHREVSTPLPEVLSEQQIDALIAVTQGLRAGQGGVRPDVRPHLLVTLLLATGIKKNECMGIVLNHLERTDPAQPALWIRYAQRSRRHKERRIPLPVWWPAILDEYLEQYHPVEKLFPWTARNLEYVLTEVGEHAGISHLSFERLRWTCAVRDWVEGMDPEDLRRKLGLSEVSWYEVEGRLSVLAQRYAQENRL